MSCSTHSIAASDIHDYEGPFSPSPVPSMLESEIDHTPESITLKSFIPILEHLPGFYLDQNLCYMIRGSLTKADWTPLRDYARTVSTFILTDENSEPRISPAAFLHLARLQPPDMPLLPSLSDLVIVDADTSIAYLDLLLTPSLKSLRASCIPNAQQSTFFSFLTAIEQEAPFLQTVVLGPGRFLSRSLETISRFNDLRHLELEHEDSELPVTFFGNIGCLPKLENLILDARHVSGTIMADEPPVPLSGGDTFPLSDDFNTNDSNRKEHVGSTADMKTDHTSLSSSSSFNRLAKLHVIGWLPLLEDLIPRIMSTTLEEISVTFIRLSYDEFKINLAKEIEERERKAEENRRRKEAEKKMEEEEKKWKDEMERRKIEEEKQWRAEQEKKRREEEQLLRDAAQNLFGSASSPPIFSSTSPSLPLFPPFGSQYDPSAETPREDTSPKGRKKKRSKVTLESERIEEEAEQKRREEQERAEQERMEMARMEERIAADRMMKEEARMEDERTTPSDRFQYRPKQVWEARERLLKEQESLASLSFDAHTVSFTELLLQLCRQSRASLKSVNICQIGSSFQCLSQSPTLPEETFRTMLFLPAIESLEVNGWMLDSLEGVLNGAQPIPDLKSLLLPLPIGKTDRGISLSTLRHVAKTCPKLESLQCHIEFLSPIPEYPVPTNAGLSHGLRKLTVGNSFPLPDTKQLYHIARHLYLLFPNLDTINRFEEHNGEQWAKVDEFVKMFQTARMDDLNRQ